ncbi:hypothetical protein SESBI_49425 [Sesbania bispinosa]|nr:hypothetical protein SESBI_49425 [Sesbania bispinosa]
MIVEKWLPPNGKKALEEELMRGREKANQLLEVLTDKSKERSKSEVPLGVAEPLVREVLRSFTNTLLLLSANDEYPKKVEPPITRTRIGKNGRGSSKRK